MWIPGHSSVNLHQDLEPAEFYFRSWSDRIPFVLLFNITTSVDLFQSKLPRATIRSLTGATFYVTQIDIEKILQDIHYMEPTLLLGSNLSSQLMDHQRNHIQSTHAFIRTLKVRNRELFLTDVVDSLVRLHDSLLRESIEYLTW